LTLLYLISVLDLLSLAISLPVLPRLFAHHGISEVVAGYTAGAHSLLVFVAGPVLGRLSDKYGRTTFLRLSALGTLVGCYLCANATSPAIFIAGRVLPGLLSCRLPVSQAYLADVTTGPERSAQFGECPHDCVVVESRSSPGLRYVWWPQAS
jgi:MFS family permease